MSFSLSHDNLLKYLNEKKLSPIFQKETNQIYILIKVKDLDIPLFFGIQKKIGLLQLLAYLPFEIQNKAFGEVARLLHIINKDIDMPGFGMDEKEKLLFYRAVIPTVEGEIKEELLGNYLDAISFACDSFIFAIGAVASGTKTMEDLTKDG